MQYHLLSAAIFAVLLPSITLGMDFGGGNLTPPDAYNVTLEFDKDTFILGELILAHYGVENTGKKPFSVTSGGDYRGTVRALRYKVTVEDEQGNKLPDPYSSASSMCMGGLCGPTEVKPGEKWYGSIRLHMYARIDKAGVYKVTVEHDLGWKKTDGVRTAASAKIRVDYPTPDDAKHVIAETLKAPRDQGGTMGKRRAPFLDLTPAVFPEYLPLLADLASNGNEEALWTIGEMAFPNATRVLIDLANVKDQKVAREALKTLNRRLPDPRWTKQLGSRGPFTEMFSMDEERRRLFDQSWRGEFSDPVRALGRRYLADPDNDSMLIGAYIIQCIGTPDDAPHLMRAVRSGLSNALQDKPETNIYPRPRGAIQELVRAIEALTDRGMKIVVEPTEREDVCVYLASLCRKPDVAQRTPYWEKHVASWVGDPNPIIRLYAIRSLPKQLPDDLRDAVAERMRDSDPDVQVSACTVAADNPCDTFRAPALTILSQTGDDWVRRQAFSVAVACKARYEALQIAADRIDESKPYAGISWLISGCIKAGSYGTSCKAPSTQEIAGVRDRWKAFLEKHERELRGGASFAPGSADLDADLFPGVTFNLPDRSNWPKH